LSAQAAQGRHRRHSAVVVPTWHWKRGQCYRWRCNCGLRGNDEDTREAATAQAESHMSNAKAISVEEVKRGA